MAAKITGKKALVIMRCLAIVIKPLDETQKARRDLA